MVRNENIWHEKHYNMNFKMQRRLPYWSVSKHADKERQGVEGGVCMLARGHRPAKTFSHAFALTLSPGTPGLFCASCKVLKSRTAFDYKGLTGMKFVTSNKAKPNFDNDL